jgi:hypothetical protein
MRKLKLMGKIPDVLFATGLLILFILWMGSFLNFKGGLDYLVSIQKLDGEEAFASENGFEKALTDSNLYSDTIWVEATTAFPDSEVWITVSIKSTVWIRGFNFAIIVGDTSILVPDTSHEIWFPCPPDSECPPETSWAIYEQKTTRTEPLSWQFWLGGVHNKHLDTTTFVGAMLDPPYLQPGTGPVVRIKFKVKKFAPEEATTTIDFAQGLPGETDKPNTFSDTLGVINFYPRTRAGTFTVKSGAPPVNQSPSFAYVPSDTQVNEGTTLSFPVTATDADNDSITLFIDPLDPTYNYNFATKKGKGSVTQTFSFSPTFTQGPDTIYVTFKAQDDHGNLSTKTVRIRIIETAQDLLIASSEQGGVPGSFGRMVPFVITNTIPIYGFQYTLRWDYTKIDIDSFVTTDAISGFSMWTNLGDSLGKVTVLVFGLANQTIPAGLETVLYAAFSVEEDAPPGDVTLELENAREAISPGSPSQPLGMVHGRFAIDMFGDANIDRLVDIADAVGVVAYILGNISFTSRQFMTADVVPNDTINVADLVGIINMILGRWTGPSPSPYFGPMATFKLDYEDLQPGNSGEVKVLADLEVPVAGAQIKIDYDPNQLSFEAPQLSDWSDKFIAEYKDDKQGKLTVLLYNFSNDPVSPGDGKFLSLPVTVKPGAINQIKLQIDEVVLADQNAVQIPVEGGKTTVPKAFELNQNYPNPFNPTTIIKYTLSSGGEGQGTLLTTLRIYNVLGEVVRTLVNEPKSPGVYQEVWDGKDDRGNAVASGIYFYQLKAGKFSETKKMVLLK